MRGSDKETGLPASSGRLLATFRVFGLSQRSPDLCQAYALGLFSSFATPIPSFPFPSLFSFSARCFSSLLFLVSSFHFTYFRSNFRVLSLSCFLVCSVPLLLVLALLLSEPR